jgi:hypothetical protein
MVEAEARRYLGLELLARARAAVFDMGGRTRSCPTNLQNPAISTTSRDGYGAAY